MPGRVAERGGMGLASMGGGSREEEGGERGAGSSSSLISPSSLATFSKLLTDDVREFFLVLTCPSSISTSPFPWMGAEEEGAGRVPFFDEEASPSSAPTSADCFLFLVLRARDRSVEGSVDLEDEEEALVDGLGEEGGGEGAMRVEEEDGVVEDRWL